MLHVFGFDRIGVAIGDLYFVDPKPRAGQEGHEHGVRLELRQIDRGDLVGSIYAAQPISVGAPIWRLDLLESLDGPVGTFDRTHHHPTFTRWDPEHRVFDAELTADPLAWLGRRLSDLEALVADAGCDQSVLGPTDVAAVREAAPEIVDVVRRLLAQVRAGELAAPPADPVDPKVGIRVGWL
jgi:hypothetical protein